MCDHFSSLGIKVRSISYSYNNHNNMKPPKLPGTEKFRFSDKKFDEYRKGLANNHNDSIDCSSSSSNFLRGIPSRSTCPSTPLSMVGPTSMSTFSRSDSKRKPILPISSRMTSRVLTLTHLPLDSFDIRDFNVSNLGNHYTRTGAKLLMPSDPRAPTTTSTSRVSLFSDCSGSQCSSSQPSPRSLCSPLDRSLAPSKWAKSAHRLSTSSQSSWEDCGPESHDNFWLSRK